MLKGLPASGKSTWAKQMVADSKGMVKRVNKDDLRAMIDAGKWSKEREKEIVKARDLMIETFLDAGYDVIVDDTNFHPPYEERFRKFAEHFNIDFIVKYFEADVDECIRRDSQRDNPVGEKAIRDMYNRYVRKFKEGEYLKQNNMLPKVYLADIDGTVAIRGDRSPYDMSKVSLDTPNLPVVTLIIELLESEQDFVFVSARNESARADTEQWIRENIFKHVLDYHGNNSRYFEKIKLFLRADGDNRRDSIVKREIFENHIKDKYYVKAVFDDREQVVKECWRDLGLPCFQVAEGKF
jgi:predicted kinase